MKNLGKIISLMLAVMLVVTLVPTANVEAATIIDSGKCGKKTTYTVTSDGTLTISGQGPMKDCDNRNGEKMPWRNSAETSEIINKVVIENGVTRIGDYAFRGLHYVTNVSWTRCFFLLRKLRKNFYPRQSNRYRSKCIFYVYFAQRS